MNRTEEISFSRASAMPAPTWHFLKMNDTRVEIPEGLAISPDVKVSEPWLARGSEDEFENALADAQETWEASHPAPTAEERAELEAFLSAEADATYGGTAQSTYQVGADALEEARSLSLAFEHGTGEEIAAYLRYASGKRVIVGVGPNKTVKAQVTISAVPDTISVAAIDVIADEGSSVDLSIVVDDPQCSFGPAVGATGVTGSTVRVFADADARVSIVRTQALGDGFTDIDDMGIFVGDRARVCVRQTVLGAGVSYAGLAGDLRGAESQVEVDTRYLGSREQLRDFNYVLRHHGQRTRCSLNANGVLAGHSSKTLRGTIDLVRGCKGAEGSEVESVLLVDEGVHNKTVPVILCSEDDVAGNHGATIGHIRDEQMFYLASRGLSAQDAERMFVGAMVEQAAIDAPDDESRAAVVHFGEALQQGFSDLLGIDD